MSHDSRIKLTKDGVSLSRLVFGAWRLLDSAARPDADQVARLIGYDDAQTVAAAALKLDPLDPVVATGWVVGVAGDIERMASAVASLTTAEQIPAITAPLIEQWAQQHAVARQRLFRA